MKNTFTQVILPLALVALVVGGLTFVTNYTVTPKALPPVAVPTTVAEPPLVYRNGPPVISGSIPTIRIVWDDDDKTFVADSEATDKGHYNLWFENRHREPVTVALESKSCQCAEVSVLTLPPGALATSTNLLAMGGWLTQSSAPDLLRPLGLAYLQNMLTGTTWQVLSDKTHNPVVVPAATDAGPTIGLIRLSWEGKDQAGPKLMAAEVTAHLPGQTPSAVRFEVPTNIAPGLQTTPATVDFGDLTESITTSRSFIVWSSTRTYLPLTAKIDPPTPCVSVTALRPLTSAECTEWSARVTAADKPKTRILAGYEVTVTVKSGQGGPQLDLGLLSHRLSLTHDTNSAVHADVIVLGLVRGDVRILNSGDDRERIMLGNFPINRGVKKTVTLTTLRPGLKLTLKEAESSTIVKAVLTPTDDLKQWKLALEVPPNRHAGDLPQDSVIVVETNDTPPRRVRLPIRGAAVTR